MSINVRKLPEEERRALKVKALAALELNKGNLKGTARQLDINRATLMTWAKESKGEIRIHRSPAPEVTETAKEVVQTLRLTEDKLEELAARLVESLTKNYEKATFYQQIGCLDRVFPMLQILRGKPTSISENTDRTLTTEEQIERAAEVLRASNMQLVPKANGTNGSNENHK